jgi:AbrB family looped-hinge helix DNA binding protein
MLRGRSAVLQAGVAWVRRSLQGKPQVSLTYFVHICILSVLLPPKASFMKTEVSTVTTKGQLVIPSKLRRKYAIRKGTQVAFVEEENRLVLQPLTPEFIRSLRGSLKGQPSALKVLRAERKRDREL